MSLGSRNCGAAAALAVLVASGAVVSSAQTPGGECGEASVRTQVFSVRFKPVADAARLVDQLLSPCGAYRVPKALKLITVEDSPERLARIGEALASWDLPPRSVEVTVSLILARNDSPPAGAGGIVGEIRGVTETLSRVTSYTSFEPLGSATARVSEGGEALLDLGDRYQVSFRVGAVDAERGIVQLGPFALQQLPAPGEVSASLGSVPRRLLSMDLDLTHGQMRLVGATGRARDKAIFLALTVWADDEPEATPAPRTGN